MINGPLRGAVIIPGLVWLLNGLVDRVRSSDIVAPMIVLDNSLANVKNGRPKPAIVWRLLLPAFGWQAWRPNPVLYKGAEPWCVAFPILLIQRLMGKV